MFEEHGFAGDFHVTHPNTTARSLLTIIDGATCKQPARPHPHRHVR
jgi:hypothetical protein